MHLIFVVVALIGGSYFALSRRRFDFLALGFFSACIYFLPGFFGYSRAINGVEAHEFAANPLSTETLAVMTAVLASLIIAGVVVGHGGSRLRGLDLLFQGSELLPRVATVVALLAFAVTVSSLGLEALTQRKQALMPELSRSHVVWAFAASVGLVSSFQWRRRALFVVNAGLLAIDVYMGFRSSAALAFIATLALMLIVNRRERLAIDRWRVVLAALLIGCFFFVYKGLYVQVKQSNWGIVSERVADTAFYTDVILLSEPFTTQTILDQTLRQRFRVDPRYHTQLLQQVGLFTPELGVRYETYSDMHRAALFPDSPGGLASNIWAEAWSSAGWAGVIVMVVLNVSILLLGSILMASRDPSLQAGVALFFSYWAFYLHRNTVAFQLSLEKRTLIVWAGCLLLAMTIAAGARLARKQTTVSQRPFVVELLPVTDDLCAGARSGFGVHKGALLVLCTAVAALLLGTVLQLALARTMGATGYGTFVYALSWLGVLTIPATLGLDVAALRFLPQYAACEQWPEFFGFIRFASRATVLVGAALSVALAAIAVLMGTPGEDLSYTLVLAAAALPLLGWATLVQGELRALHRAIRSQLPLTVVRPGCLLLLVAIAYGAGGSVTAPRAMQLNLVAVALALSMSLFWLRGALRSRSRAAAIAGSAGEWLRVSLPLLLVGGSRVLMRQTDVILVGTLLGVREAGIYAVASRVAALISTGLTASNIYSGPLISDHVARERRDALQRVVTASAAFATGSSLLVMIAVVAFGPPLLGLFGAPFAGGFPVLVILGVGQLVNALTGPVGQLLNVSGLHATNARIAAVAALANLLVGLPAVVLLGAPGAATTTSGVVAVRNLWAWQVARHRLEINASAFGRWSSDG